MKLNQKTKDEIYYLLDDIEDRINSFKSSLEYDSFPEDIEFSDINEVCLKAQKLKTAYFDLIDNGY